MKNATKLTDSDKAWLKTLKSNFALRKGKVFQYKKQGVTICVAPTDNYAGKRDAGTCPKFYEISTAYCNQASDKFREKIGKFVALQNYDNGMTVKIPSNGYKTAKDIADQFSVIVEL